MRKPVVVVVGAGGHARVLIDILRLRKIPVAGITDRKPAGKGRSLDGVKLIGDDSALERFSPRTTRLVNAIGSTQDTGARRTLFQRLRRRGFRFMTLIHPSAIVAGNAEIGEGAQLMAGAIVQPGAKVGANTILNTGAQVDHDCIVGSHVHLAPRSTLSGSVRVGDGAHIGTGATVIQGLRLGAGCLVAAGAVVVVNVAAGERVAGVPARRITA